MSHSLDGIELVPENACPECGVDVNELTAEIDKLRKELLKLQIDHKILREALIERLERDRRNGRDVS